LNAAEKTNTKIERKGEIQSNYTGSSLKLRVVQSPCTSKGFSIWSLKITTAQAHK